MWTKVHATKQYSNEMIDHEYLLGCLLFMPSFQLGIPMAVVLLEAKGYPRLLCREVVIVSLNKL
jgi:hypothetical protein